MSANINRFQSKKILMVVANPSVSTTLGWPVGFWASELTHAWSEFHEAGHEVVVASPRGGRVELDALSDPRDASGYSADDVLSMGFLNTPRLAALFEDTSGISGPRAADFDALYVAGGQSPMFTFRSDAGLLALIREFYEGGKATALVCHGTCAPLEVKLADGTPLIRGRQMTGFANSEEDYADKVVGKKVMPFRIEDEARLPGANFVTAPARVPRPPPVAQAVAGAEVVFLTVPADVAVQAAGAAGNLSGKILVDCTNPVKFDAGGPVLAPPAEGSVPSALMAAYPGLRVVKAFNGFGAEFHLDPNVAGKPADMFMAGDDPDAKKVVGTLADRAGYKAIDAGPAPNAAHLEAMAVIWIHLAVKGSMGRHFTFQMTQRG